MVDGTEFRKHYRNRNLARLELQREVRDAVRDVLAGRGISCERVEDFEPVLSNTVYDLVKEFWEAP